MLFKSNQFLRKSKDNKAIKAYKKQYAKRINEVLDKQIDSIPQSLVYDSYQYFLRLQESQIQNSVKRTLSKEQINNLKDYIRSKIDNSKILAQDNSNSIDLKEIVGLLILDFFSDSILQQKLKFAKKMKEYSKAGFDVNGIITKLEFELTNKEIASTIDRYNSTLNNSLNEVQKKRITNNISSSLLNGKDAAATVTGLSLLYKTNRRRSNTITITESTNAIAYGVVQYATRRGLQTWTWLCNAPEDLSCIIACGVSRRIGDLFPNGLKMPTVHPNCECVVEPDYPKIGNVAGVAGLLIFLKSGYDWVGN